MNPIASFAQSAMSRLHYSKCYDSTCANDRGSSHQSLTSDVAAVLLGIHRSP